MSRRVYVVGAYLPNGGTFMAYHLARLLHLDFGYDAMAVQMQGETADNGVFAYDPVFPSIDLDGMLAAVTERDILIANPSFSAYSLGLRCRCRKVMYVQGFNTFDLIDPGFDLYVSVSVIVQRFLKALYGIETRVIPPFITPLPASAPSPLPWRARPEKSVLVSLKGGNPMRQDILFDRLQSILAEHENDIRMDVLPPDKIPHTRLLERFGAYRYFLSLSPAEGFGLMPIEAMSTGCLAMGFDAFGGRDYFKPDDNCLVTPFADIAGIAQRLRDAIAAPERAAAIAQAGQATAGQALYSQSRFYDDWRALLRS